MTAEIVPVPRGQPSANTVALRAVRSILDAAEHLALNVEGTLVHVEVERLPPEPWPAHGLEGLDQATDGPLPRAVRLSCSWPGGGVELLLSATWWRGNGTYRQLIGLRTSVPITNREVGWITVALPLRGRREGDRVPVPSAFYRVMRRDQEQSEMLRRHGFALKSAVERSGLPRVSAWRAEAFVVRVPTGEVEPSPLEAFRRLVHLALLKLPFFVYGEGGTFTGKPPFDADALPLSDDSEAPEGGDELLPGPGVQASGDRRAGIGPMPGGVRQYKTTLDALLTRLQETSLSEEELLEHLRERYEVSGENARHTYVTVLLNLGVVRSQAGRLELTAEGEEYLRDPRPHGLFGLLHRKYTGLLEVLVLAEVLGSADTTSMRAFLPQLLGTTWRTDNQTNFRRNWLLSLGATERSDGSDSLTEVGRQLLATYSAEAELIRERVASLIEAGGEAGPADAAEQGDVELEDVSITPRVNMSPPPAPSGWDADRLELPVSRAVAHARGLELPQRLMEQACAALSAGKHLLLVGPPGTGKTELAHALVEAARTEGYCAGAFVSTASADWTTFDTIGGYALQRDGSLQLRPGAFLRALERWQWLVIDELNRADVDRAFGELMTVLAGCGTDTALVQADGRLVSIGMEPGCTHRVPRTFRVIATMNTWDKTSLFRLSHAVQRRFAILHVDVPDDTTYARLLESHASREGMDPALPEGSLTPLRQLFSSSGILAHRAIGPAVGLDMVRYMRRRQASGDGLAEAMEMFLLPQLEGLEQEPAARVLKVLTASLAGWASAEATERMRTRYQELFPHLTFESA